MPSFSELAQSIVNSLDEGLGRRILRCFLFVCLVGGLLGGYTVLRFRGLRDAEAMDSAQLARSLVEGRGYATRAIRPLDAGLLMARRTADAPAPAPGRFPELRRPPLYPMLLSWAFRLVGPSFESPAPGALHQAEARVIVPLNLLLTLSATVLLYVLGLRLFSPAAAGAGAAAYLVCERTLAQGIGGSPRPLVALLVVAATLAAVHCRLWREGGWRGAMFLLLTAVCAAGAVLAGYAAAAALVVPVAIVGSAYPHARWRAVGATAVVAALCLLPWLMHLWRQSGSLFGTAPYALLHDTFLFFPADGVDRAMGGLPSRPLVALALKVKAVGRLAELARNPAGLFGGGLIGAFFLISFFVGSEKPLAGTWRWATLGGAAGAIALACLGPSGAIEQAGAALLPLAVLAAAGAFVAVIERLFIEDILKDALAWVFVGWTALPVAIELLNAPPPSPYPPVHPPYVAFVAGLVGPEETVCSDTPWAVAWYGDRDALLLPGSPAELEKLHEAWRPLAALYLTTETGDGRRISELLDGPHAPWLPVLERRVPEGFPFRHGIALPPGGHDQLALFDRVRWAENLQQNPAEDGAEESLVEEDAETPASSP